MCSSDLQKYNLINTLSAKENIILPLVPMNLHVDIIEEKLKRVLKMFHIEHKEDVLVKNLSGGEQQRVAMARALSHNPILILADEPTGNLDEYSADLIWNLLEGANEQLNTTVIVVTHSIPHSLNVDYRYFPIEYGSIRDVR